MPNKKINQLDVRVAVSTDLMLVGDPSTGTSFKSTLNTLPLVPYTGATGAVSLGLFGLTAGSLTLQPQALNSDTYKITQQMATNDYWSIYGFATVADYGDLYFELQDNAAFANGQRFRFHYGNDSSGTPKDILLMDYNGATIDGALTVVNTVSADQVLFDQTPTGTAGVGVMRWNDSDGTLDFGLKGGNVTLQLGQEQVQRVVNKSGSNLLESNYQVVKVTSAQGQRLAVDLAQGNNDANSTDTIGIVTETINNNQEGFITTSGIIRGINTTGSLQSETWVDGDVLYLSPTVAGRITNIKPIAPNHTVTLGYVVYAHANNGKIFVKCDNGYEIGELHDVYVPTPSNNDGIFWNSANSRYQNNSIVGVLGYTPQAALTLTTTGTSGAATLIGSTLNIPQYSGGGGMAIGGAITSATAGSVLFAGASGVLAQDNANFFWDDANNRLGIGTATPNTRLHIVSSSTAASLIARGSYFQNTLTASANNDVLVGMDIDNTFVQGSFSNVTNVGLRVKGTIQFNDDAILMFSDKTFIFRSVKAAAWGDSLLANFFQVGDTNPAVFFTGKYGSVISRFAVSALCHQFTTNIFNNNRTPTGIFEITNGTTAFLNVFSTGNLTINSTTDAGYRLDVNGTARVSGAITGNSTLTVNGSITCGGLSTVLTSAGLEVTASTDLVIKQNNTTAGGHRFVINQGGTEKNVFKIFRSTNVLIQDGGTFTDTASSQLTIESTTKGFLPPRMTTTQKSAISSPVAGLQVYDSTLNQMSYYNGTTWVNF